MGVLPIFLFFQGTYVVEQNLAIVKGIGPFAIESLGEKDRSGPSHPSARFMEFGWSRPQLVVVKDQIAVFVPIVQYQKTKPYRSIDN